MPLAEAWSVFISNFSNILVAVVGFFLMRTLRQIDKTLEKIDEKVDDHEGRISWIEGNMRGRTK